MTAMIIDLNFKKGGEDAVLIAGSGNDWRFFLKKISEFHENKISEILLNDSIVKNYNVLICKSNINKIEFNSGLIKFYFDNNKLDEIIDKINGIISLEGPCHNYIEIDRNSDIIISKDEYREFE